MAGRFSVFLQRDQIAPNTTFLTGGHFGVRLFCCHLFGVGVCLLCQVRSGVKGWPVQSPAGSGTWLLPRMKDRQALCVGKVAGQQRVSWEFLCAIFPMNNAPAFFVAFFPKASGPFSGWSADNLPTEDKEESELATKSRQLGRKSVTGWIDPHPQKELAIARHKRTAVMFAAGSTGWHTLAVFTWTAPYVTGDSLEGDEKS